MKKNTLIIGILAITLYGFVALVDSPYYALFLGDRELYLRLKANPIAVHDCLNLVGPKATAKVFDRCIDEVKPEIISKLRTE